MRIFLNDEEWKLPQVLENELRTELIDGKTLKFPKEYESTTTDEEGNRVKEWPKVISIPYRDSLELDLDTGKPGTKESKNGRYVNVRIADSVGGTKERPTYEPGSLLDLGTLHTADVVKYWFLKYCSRFVKGGSNAAANKNKNYSCIIDNPVEDERLQAEREAIIYKAQGYIWGGDIPEEKLRNIAAVFGVKDSVNGRLPGVKLKLKSAVERDEIVGLASGGGPTRGHKFLIELVEKDGFDFSLRANISKAIELNVVEYVGSMKGWYFLGETKPGEPKKYEEKIVGCEPTVDSLENYLAEHLRKNTDMKVRFEEKLSEKLKAPNVTNEAEFETLKTQKAQFENDGDVEKVIEVLEKMLLIKPNDKKLKKELDGLKA
jgi:hypothetical protein